MAKDKIATEYEIRRHGIMHSDCFQGCSEGSLQAVFTGIGDNPADALRDALDSAGQAGWDYSIITETLPETPSVSKQEEEECEQARQEALDAWKEKQLEAGKTERTDEWDGTDEEYDKTFHEDDFEWDEDKWKDRHSKDCWYYLSVRLSADTDTDEDDEDE